MVDRLPPLNALRAFEAAARLLSFQKAAAELHVTPAAVSHQIRGLEEHLGTDLFRRLNRSLVLTDAGTTILPDIQEGFACFGHAMERLRALDDSGVLRVAAALSFAAKWLVPRLHRFQALHPEVEVRIMASTTIQDYARDGIDIGVRYGRGNYPGLVSERLLDESFYPVCSPKLLNGDRALKSPADLRHHMLLHDDSMKADAAYPDWAMWLAAAGAEGVDHTRGPRFNLPSDTLTAAIEGAGVALGRASLAEIDIRAGRLVRPFELSIPVEFTFFVVYPEENLQRPEVRSFREWLQEEARHPETT